MGFIKNIRPNYAEKKTDTLQIEGEGCLIDIKVRYNLRAKRYTLRVQNQQNFPVLTIPKHGSLKQAKKFVLSHVDWLNKTLKDKAERISIEPDVLLPFKGINHRLYSTGKKRGTVTLKNDHTLWVDGELDHFERRVIDWLKKQAKIELLKASHYHAENLGLTFKSLTVRDPKTRWGSCSSYGSLNYSWRLIMAPPEILDYVAAHEVAHLQEMNHGPKFWALVEKTCPDMKAHRAWLKAHGNQLHLYSS